MNEIENKEIATISPQEEAIQNEAITNKNNVEEKSKDKNKKQNEKSKKNAIAKDPYKESLNFHCEQFLEKLEIYRFILRYCYTDFCV